MADEAYASTRLFLKLDLPLERNTVLHFFEQIRKAFPSMRRFHRRDNGTLVLEEAARTGPSRRWVRLDPGSLRFGHYAPQADDDIRRLGDVVLEQAPYHLTLSEIDFNHMETLYGFDLEFRGNHDQLLAEVFWSEHPLGGLLGAEGVRHVIDAQPYLGVSLTPQCDLQAYFEVKSRTGTYEVRTEEYESQSISVLLTVRKYWGYGGAQDLVGAYHEMLDAADSLAEEKAKPLLINPLAHAIASRS
jgi:hypothetical protein